MAVGPAVAVAVTFVWLGMVLAISFLEAPLKFRAPDVTIRIGLGIGRMVFRALNTVEVVLAATLIAVAIPGRPATTAVVAGLVAIVILIGQLLLVRPRLNRRSDAILAGDEEAPRSRAHLAYVALELVKVAALIVVGATLLSA